MRCIKILLLILFSNTAFSQLTSMVMHGDTLFSLNPSTGVYTQLNRLGTAASTITLLAAKADTDHTHSYNSLTNIPAAIDITGKVSVSDTASMLNKYLRSNIAAATYGTITNLNLKVNISDTANMLSNYRTGLNSGVVATTLKLNISDTAGMLAKYYRGNDANATFATITNLALKANIADTAGMLSNYKTGLNANTAADLLKAPIASPTFTGTVSMPSLTVTGSLGYTSGAGGTITQATSKSTGVTINKISGTIITTNTSLAAGAEAAFTVTNSTVAIGDVIVLSIRSGQTALTSVVFVTAVANGSFQITISNLGTIADTGAMTINFAVIKAVNN